MEETKRGTLEQDAQPVPVDFPLCDDTSTEDYDVDGADAEYSSDDDSDQEGHLIDDFNEMLEKLRFLYDLYKEKEEENKELARRVDESVHVIQDMKTEMQSLIQKHDNAVNELMIEKRSHGATLKQLENLKNKQEEKPFSGTLRCRCEVVISNGEIESINIERDAEERWQELQHERDELFNRVVRLTQANTLMIDQLADFQATVDLTKKNCDREILDIQQAARQQETSLFKELSSMKNVVSQFLGNELKSFCQDQRTLVEIQRDDELRKEFSDFIKNKHNVDVSQILNSETRFSRVMNPKPGLRRQRTQVLTPRTTNPTPRQSLGGKLTKRNTDGELENIDRLLRTSTINLTDAL